MLSVNRDKQLHLSFLGEGITDWIGGIDFLRLCASGIRSVTELDKFDLLMPEKTFKRAAIESAVIAKRKIFSLWMRTRPVSVIPSKKHVVDALGSIGYDVRVIECPGSRRGIAQAMKECHSNLIFPCMRSMGKDFPYGWIGYIADLQHKRLPHYFSRRDSYYRDKTYRQLLLDAQVIIVNAKNVIDDIEEFYPERKAKLFALPFCPPINTLEDIPDENLLRYQLPEKYFLVCNQFWIHKSHKTVFEALRILKEIGQDVHVVCTGNQHDYRRPEHFQDLKRYIHENRLDENVIFLGVIPKQHQLAIMRRALAVIQPTLFEGGPGGGAVYDAISTSTPAIVSDIKVNREIDCGVVEFFRSGSPEDLAEKMILNLKNPPGRLGSETMRSLLAVRQQRMGEVLMQAFKYALSNQ